MDEYKVQYDHFKRIRIKTFRLVKTYMTKFRFTIRKTFRRMIESTSKKRWIRVSIHHLRMRRAIFFSWFSSVFFWVDFLISPLFPLSGWFSLHFSEYFSSGFYYHSFFFFFKVEKVNFRTGHYFVKQKINEINKPLRS